MHLKCNQSHSLAASFCAQGSSSCSPLDIWLSQGEFLIPLKCTWEFPWNAPGMHLSEHPKSLPGSIFLRPKFTFPHLLVHPRAFNQGTLLPLTCTMVKPKAELGRYLNLLRHIALLLICTLQGWAHSLFPGRFQVGKWLEERVIWFQ